MESYRTTSAPSATEKFRMPVLRSLSGHTRVVEPATARPAQLIPNRITWPSAGLMPVSPTGAARQHQDGQFAGFGGCDVTDPKFSTRVGPPSCSPPV